MIEQAVVIAGGYGTRLQKHGIQLPKSLIEIDGKTIVEWQLINLERDGITEILFLLGQNSGEIIEYLNSIRSNTSCKLEFKIEESPLGTGGALLNSIELLKDQFLVVYGDLLLDCSLKLKSDLIGENLDGLIFTRPSDHPFDSDLVEIDFDNFITDINLKPNKASSNKRNIAMTGLTYLTKKVVSDLKTVFGSGKFDLEKDLITFAIKNRKGFKAQKFNGFVKDIGTIDRLENAEILWQSRLDWKNPQKTIILDRDGVINILNGEIGSLEHFKVVEDFVYSINLLRNLKFRIFVATNQPGIAKGFFSWKDLDELHGYVDMLLSSKGIYLDGWYVCPHHPESGFPGEISELKIDCLCRKPKPGLLSKINSDFPIDLKKSWFIGDQMTDFQAATAFGLDFIRIGNNFEVSVDVPSFEKLSSACNYIADVDKLRS